MGNLFCYSIGIFLGIQLGIEIKKGKYNKVNNDYYKNNQMNYRFNK